MNRATKIFIGFSVGVLAVLLAIYLADLALNRGHVPRGTTVGGVAIGGLTPQEAEAELKAQLGDAPSRPILSLIHISEPTRRLRGSRMPSSA